MTEPDLRDRARAGPARDPRDAGPAARASPRRTWASASSCRCSRPATRASAGRSRRPMRCGGGTASGPVTRARLVGTGLPAPFERDPRNPLDRRARGVPVDADGGRCDAATRVVTAKVTRTSTRFRPTTLDIERLFGLVVGINRTDVLSDECPGRHDPATRPRKGAIPMAFIRVEPVTGPGPDRLVQRSSA